MVALTRLKASETYRDIIKLFLNADRPRLLVSGATALTNIGSVAAISALLTQANAAHLPLAARREIIIAIAQLGHIDAEIYKFLKPDEDETKSELDLFESISDTDENDDWLNKLQPLLDKSGNEAELLQFISDAVKTVEPQKNGLSTQRLGRSRQRKTLFNHKPATATTTVPSHKAALLQAMTNFCDQTPKNCNRELLLALLAIFYRVIVSQCCSTSKKEPTGER